MLTKERVLELMKEAGLDEKKFQTLMEKEEAQLTPDELDEVTGKIDAMLAKVAALKSLLI